MKSPPARRPVKLCAGVVKFQVTKASDIMKSCIVSPRLVRPQTTCPKPGNKIAIANTR
jgi:hypothetical protein